MSSSLRWRRMARNHKRMAKPARLNLVALMDIFTILVLFLIVNNGDVEVLQLDNKIALPESVSEQRPEAAIVVTITATEILVAQRSVVTLEDAQSLPGDILPALERELRYQASLAQPLVQEEENKGRAIVLMGDQRMPYKVLKRVMATCATTDYRDISLAVNSNPPAPGALSARPASQLALSVSDAGRSL